MAIRTANPWLTAAESMSSAADPLARMMVTLPQIRAQMQHQADQMGLQQAEFGLRQQEFEARKPYYSAEAARWTAEADKSKVETETLRKLLELAESARKAKTQAMTVGFTGAPTMDNARMLSKGQTLGDLVAGAMLGQSPAASALASEQRTINIPLNATMATPEGQIVAQGARSIPGQNYYYGPSSGTNLGAQLQAPLPREFSQLDPTTRAKNLTGAAKDVAELDSDADVGAYLAAAAQIIQALQGTNAPVIPPPAGTNAPVRIKSIRQIK